MVRLASLAVVIALVGAQPFGVLTCWLARVAEQPSALAGERSCHHAVSTETSALRDARCPTEPPSEIFLTEGTYRVRVTPAPAAPRALAVLTHAFPARMSRHTDSPAAGGDHAPPLVAVLTVVLRL